MAAKDKPANKTVKQSWWQKLTGKSSPAKAETESDVFEEKAEKWTEFIKLLVEILRECPQLNLIVTLRSDFEPRFQESDFGEGWADARFLVRPMRSDELREAVEKPAMEKALYFDPPKLVDELVDEVSQMPGALPLLSFTLSEMYIQLYKAWSKEGKGDRALTVTEDFEQKGGVAGALTRRANEEFRNLPSPKKAHRLTMQRVMLRMVELEGGEAVRRRVLKSELTYPSKEENERVETVLAKLQQARLIVTGKDADANKPYYEPAHDYLVRGWERLQVWITKEQDNLALQDLLTPAAKAWKKENTDLWDTNSRLDRLKEIQDKDTVDDNWLNKIESEFVEHSYNTKTKKQRNFRIGSIAIISTLAVLSIVAVSFGLQSRKRERMQFARRLANTSELIRDQRADLHEPSILVSLESIEISQKINELVSETNSALRNGLSLLPNTVALVSHDNSTNQAVFSHDGEYLAIGSSKTVKLVKINNPKETVVFRHDSINQVVFSHDGEYLAIGSSKTVKLVKINNPKETVVFRHDSINQVVFSHDGEYLAILRSCTKKT